jgi:hypothetical protein
MAPAYMQIKEFRGLCRLELRSGCGRTASVGNLCLGNARQGVPSYGVLDETGRGRREYFVRACFVPD